MQYSTCPSAHKHWSVQYSTVHMPLYTYTLVGTVQYSMYSIISYTYILVSTVQYIRTGQYSTSLHAPLHIHTCRYITLKYVQYIPSTHTHWSLQYSKFPLYLCTMVSIVQYISIYTYTLFTGQYSTANIYLHTHNGQ